MTDLAKKILETIKEKKLKPDARIKFLIISYFWAFLAFLMVVFGSLAVSVMIFYLKNEDWEMYSKAGFSKLNMILLSVPYFWIILSALFILGAYYNFRHTKFGYRYRFSIVVAIYFVFTLLVGSLSYSLGVGEKMEGMFYNNNLVFYGKMLDKRQEMWHKPDMGFVIGEVISMDLRKNQIKLIDPENNEWIVDISKAILPPFLSLDMPHKIRVIGKIISNNEIKAEIIKPFFIEPDRDCLNDPRGCNLIHRPMMKENMIRLRIIN
ncbi:MAG: hypothetical protein WC070_00980 [Candidatus Magasanikbacteria bacterium]